MNKQTAVFSLVIFCLVFQPTIQSLPLVFRALPAAASQPALVSAVICENVKERSAQYPAIVFSVTIGKVSCFSVFDPVPQKTFIHHNWYYRNKLTNKIKLALNPPRWSTFSTIQLQESDIGPWRVEITDQADRVIKTLRFSVSE